MKNNLQIDVDYSPYIIARKGRKPQSEIEKPHKTQHGNGVKAMAFLMIAVLFCFSFFVADFYTNGGVLAVWKEKELDFAKTFYVYCVDSYHQNSHGLVSADFVKESGGAGYLFFDGKYYLAAAVYKTEADAVKIKTDTKNSGGLIYRLDIENPKLDWCKSKHKKSVLNALAAAYDVYAQLYNVSVRLEKNEMDVIDAIAKMNVLSEHLKTLTADFDKSTNQQKQFGFMKTKTYLLVLEALVENARSETVAGKNALGAVRYAYTASLFLAASVSKSL